MGKKGLKNMLLFCLVLLLHQGLPSRPEAAALPERALSMPGAYAYSLLKEAGERDDTEALALLEEAARLSPDNPAVYFELFSRSLTLNPREFFQSMSYLFDGIKAYGRNFWWSLNLTGVIAGAVLLTLFLLSLLIGAARLPLDIPLLKHEIEEDDRKAALLAVLVASLFGPYYFLASVCFLSFLHLKERARYASYLLLLSLALTPSLSRYLGAYLTASFSPDVKAVAAVNEGLSNAYALNTLKGKEGLPARFSYALALQREGRFEEAVQQYEGLLAEEEDPRFYVNLGNCYAGMNLLDRAMEMYKRAVGIRPLLSAYYNLSMVAREKLDFVVGDRYFLKAVRMDFDRVIRFRELRNDYETLSLMDETLSRDELTSLVMGGGFFPFDAGGSLAFLGFSLLLIALLYLKGDSWAPAVRCPKCGRLFCLKCERHLCWGGMCTECFRSMISFESRPSERINTILKTYNYIQRRRMLLAVLSYTIPGLTLIYSGRMFSGLVFSSLFLFSFSVLVLSRLFTFNIQPYSHGWLSFVAVLAMAAVYLSANIYTLRRLRKGWL